MAGSSIHKIKEMLFKEATLFDFGKFFNCTAMDNLRFSYLNPKTYTKHAKLIFLLIDIRILVLLNVDFFYVPCI